MYLHYHWIFLFFKLISFYFFSLVVTKLFILRFTVYSFKVDGKEFVRSEVAILVRVEYVTLACWAIKLMCYLWKTHTVRSYFSHSYCRCYVATASPAKFQETVEKAGVTFSPPETVLMLDKLATRYENLERSQDWCKDWEDRLRAKIQSVTSVRKNGEKCYR